MDPIISTERLKLTLVTKVEKGSKEWTWLRELWTTEKSMFWNLNFEEAISIHVSDEDTFKALKRNLPIEDQNDGEEKAYRVPYAVHEVLNPKEAAGEDGLEGTRFIGFVTLPSCNAHSLPLPEHLTIPAAEAEETLTSELAYMFLPSAWGKGYATEAINGVLEACKRAKDFWAPWEKIYVRVIVNHINPASQRVMAKVDGMERKGIFEWKGKEGERVWLAGEWKTEDTIVVYGKRISLME